MKTFLLFFTLLFTISNTKAQTGNCSPGTAHDSLTINNVNARVNSGGDMWRNINDNKSAYIVPKASGSPTLFAGSIWIGGLDSTGQLHIAANTYRQNGVDFFPGPADGYGGTTTQNICQQFDQVWKVTRKEVNTVDSLFYYAGGMNIDSSQIPSDILKWPGTENPFNTIVGDRNLAPFYDANGDGIYDPTTGDIPFFPGDEALYWVYNDAGNTHGETKGVPLNIEIHGLAFAYNAPGYIGNTTFYEFNFINKSKETLHKVYVGIWVDPGLLCNSGTYVGCDSAKSTAFVYPRSTTGLSCSGAYNNKVPAMSVRILEGLRDSTGEEMGMSNFITYNNDFSVNGNPQKPADYYNYMRSIFTDGTHATHGGNGYGGITPTNYMFNGNPADAMQWSMCNTNSPASDYRMLLSCGPIELYPGAVNPFVFSVTWDTLQTSLPCPSVTGITTATDSVISYFQRHSASYQQYNGVQNIQPVKNQVAVFPSVATGGSSFTVAAAQTKWIKVFDITGRMVESLPFNNSNTISISTNGWAPGMYFCNATQLDGTTETVKLIVQ